jgi:hypothetical protein
VAVVNSALSGADWKYHRDLGRRFEEQARCATAPAQKLRYYRLAGDSYHRSSTLAPYDHQHMVATQAARCYDAAALAGD